MIRRKLIVLSLATIAVVLAPSTARADDSAVRLPFVAQPSDLVLDETHGHLFATGGVSDGAIVVTSESGDIVGSIDGEAGAAGMALVGNQLFVARCGLDTIDVIDTATLTRTGSIPIASGLAGTCRLAVAGGRIWFASSESPGPLGSVTLAAPHSEASYPALDNVMGPVFATSPTHPDLLAVGDGVDCSASVRVYDVSAATPALMGSAPANCVPDLTITADGHLLVAGYYLMNYVLPDLSSPTPYPGVNSTKAVAESAGGAYLTVGLWDVPGVVDFRTGETTPFRSHQIGNLVNGDLVTTSDGRHSYALSHDSSTGHSVLQVLDGPALTRPTLTLTSLADTITRGRSVTLHVHLSSHAENSLVRIYRSPAGGTRALIGEFPANASGDLSLKVHPGRTTTYEAAYQGDAENATAHSRTRTVRVRVVVGIAQRGWYARSGLYRLYHKGASVKISTHVSPNKHGHCVRFTIGVRRPSGSWYAVQSKCIRLSVKSRVRIRVGGLAVGARYRIDARYAGDKLNLANQSKWLYFRATA